MTLPAPERPLIRGLVAQILNARELVINKGSDDKVARGMKFRVLADAPLQVKDPETDEVIGIIDREKVQVEATEVQPHMSVCRTYRTRSTGGGPLYGVQLSSTWAMRSMYAPPEEVPETLEAAKSSFPAPLTQEESYVKIKDRVVEVREATAKK